MERWIRAVAVCLAVLLTWNGAVVGEKTAEEIANDHACTYFRYIDANGDGVVTYVDYAYAWLHVPLCGKQGLLVRDIKRQLDILKQFAYQFPMTDRNFIESLLTLGISMDEYLAAVKEKRFLPIYKKQIDEFLNFIFNALTYDGDANRVSPYEFSVLYGIFSIPGADTSFAKLDSNGDKNITRDEATPKAYNYFITADDPQSAYLIGPPLTCEEVRKRVRAWVDPIAEGRLVLSIDKFCNRDALLDLLRSVPGLSDLLPNLQQELLSIGSALLEAIPK